MFECITISDHIRLEPYTHAALAKGQAVVLAGGALVGFADYDFPADEAVMLDIGVQRAVFSADANDVEGTPAAGTAIYIKNDGTLTMTAASNTLLGLVTGVDGAVSFVKLERAGNSTVLPLEFRITPEGMLQYRAGDPNIRFRVSGNNLEYTGPGGFAAKVEADGHCWWRVDYAAA